MQRDYVPRMINFERSDYQIVRRFAAERGLGERGLSAAVRMIIREWQAFHLQDPLHLTIEEAARLLIDRGFLKPPTPSSS